MPEITIALIQALRERTGAGIMDCKRALQQNDGDIEKSIDFLREKGIAKASTRANRTAAQGLANVKFCEHCGKGVVVEVNCETDFVATSDAFKTLTQQCTDTILEKKPATIEEAKALTDTFFADAAVSMGEKFDLRRFVILSKEAGQGFGSYIHMGGKIAVAVILDKEDAEFSKQLAMHIAANNPYYIALEDVPAADRDRETAIARSEVAADEKLINKPDSVKEMIVGKKVDKTLSVSCLTLQNFLMDDSKTVGQVLKEKGINVVKFVRYEVGEGIVAAAE